MGFENQGERVSHALGWVAFLSVFGHVFCCGLPLVLGIVSLLTGFGMFSVALPMLDHIHALFWDFEVPAMVFSAIMLAIGWGVQIHARTIDCHDTGCVHEPCGGKKRRTATLLWMATVIFAFNLVAFTVFQQHVHYPAIEQAGVQG